MLYKERHPFDLKKKIAGFKKEKPSYCWVFFVRFLNDNYYLSIIRLRSYASDQSELGGVAYAMPSLQSDEYVHE